MKNEVTIIEAPELATINKSEADQIRSAFIPMAMMLDGFDEQYKELMAIPIEDMTLELTKKYKRLRLDIGKVRIDTIKQKDKEKEYVNLKGKAIMGVCNILVWAVKEKEDKLKERENYYEIQAKKERDELQAKRVLELTPFVEDAGDRMLYGMSDDVWDAYLTAKKKAFNDIKEAEEKAEKERQEKIKAEKIEQERIRKENEKLKAEAVERERLAEIEYKKYLKIENERKAKEKAERLEREAKEKKQREEYEFKLKAEREENERKQREEEAKRKKLQDELKAKQEAERKAKEDEAARIQAELNKGDAEKVKDLKNDLAALKTKYAFESDDNKEMYAGVCTMLDKINSWIKK